MLWIAPAQKISGKKDGVWAAGKNELSFWFGIRNEGVFR
jgi:hypothetical protein